MDEYQRVKDAIDLEAYCSDNLEPRGRRTYVCPLCGSGDGPNHTAAFCVTGDRWHCFACGAGGDVFDLIGAREGIEDKAAQLERAAELAGVTLDKTAGRRGAVSPSKALSSTDATTTPQDGGKTPEKAQDQADYTAGRARHRAYLEAMRANIADPAAAAYLAERGYTVEQAAALGMGYDPNPPHGWQDRAGTWHRGGRIILPWRGADYYHVDRAMADDAGNLKYDKPAADEVGPQPIYNLEAVRAGGPLFIVEGVMDALAVEQAGYQAVALGNANGIREVAAELKGNPAARCIIMTDNDKAGNDGAAKIAAALDAAHVPHIGYDYHGAAKDPDDERRAGGDLAAWYAQAVAELDAHAAEAWDTELETLEVKDPANVAGDLFLGDGITDPVPTGLTELDRIMGGGLPSRGLVVLGAMSSTGKTTLCVQLADHIARSGRPVLFATLEQSAAEIVAKSVARMASSRTRPNGGPIYVHTADLTTRTGRAAVQRDDAKNAAVLAAYSDYVENVAPSLRILETAERTGTSRLETAARAMARHYGQAPIIVCDYLQILAPPDTRMSDKQAADLNVSDLRRLARDMDTCVLAVSSLNRASYNAGGISLESFKESGGIEYGADVLLGLQPRGLKAKTSDEDDDKKVKAITRSALEEYKRTMGTDDGAAAEIVLLKNRGGAVGVKPAALTFHGDTGTFCDAPAAATSSAATVRAPKRI